MAYLQDMGLGGVISPSEMRVGEIFNFVSERRRAGKSDAEIVTLLSKTSGLSRISHPCADSKGNNICSASEIAKGIAGAAGVAAQQAAAAASRPKTPQSPPAESTLFTTRNIMVAGGALAALWFLSKGKI